MQARVRPDGSRVRLGLAAGAALITRRANPGIAASSNALVYGLGWVALGVPGPTIGAVAVGAVVPRLAALALRERV